MLTSVTLGVASSVANDVIMRIADLVAGCERLGHELRGQPGLSSE